jgi:AcrR family transcriptional regulator
VASADQGDPQRVMELLWGERPRPKRGPRQALTLEEVIAEAAGIAETEGMPALSMRRLASRLGVGAASLYTYVAGKEELCALMLDHAVSRDTLPHSFPGTWREKTTAWARKDWQDFTAHPWSLQLAASRQLAGPGALAWLDSAAQVFVAAGLPNGEAVAAVHSVSVYVQGQARAAVSEAETLRAIGPDGRSWRQVEGEYLRRHVDLRQYPTLAAASAHDRMPEPADVFEFGLQSLLDGIQARIERRT